MLNLKRPIYEPTAAYGHFGRTDVELPWEQLDKVEELKKVLGASFGACIYECWLLEYLLNI